MTPFDRPVGNGGLDGLVSQDQFVDEFDKLLGFQNHIKHGKQIAGVTRSASGSSVARCCASGRVRALLNLLVARAAGFSYAGGWCVW